MDFKSDKPIYRQIVDYGFSCIVSGRWTQGERLPSVRELALQMSVNTHTVLKAFDYLQLHEIIAPKRGMGFYLCDGARTRVLAIRREEFFNSTLPSLFTEMRELGVSPEELMAEYKKCEEKS